MAEIEIGGKMLELSMETLFKLCAQVQASDLHIKEGMPPTLRVDGDLKHLPCRVLTEDEVSALGRSMFNERLAADFAGLGNADFAHAMASGERFRVNVYRQRNKVGISCRRVIRKIPTFDELFLPTETLTKLCRLHQGLILFVGQTGCGKSTSIASCLEFINQNRACHIVTVEDPIEYLYEDKKSFVSQREVGTDVESMDVALKYLMREDPDVVLIGEMRDRDTFEAAIRASETGHLVFATLHASSPTSAIGRILDLYPDQQQNAVRQNLSFNLAAIVCQILLPTAWKKSKRVPAMEVLIATSMVRKLIRDGEDEKLPEVIASGMSEGMLTFTSSFLQLVEQGAIGHQTAYEFAPNQDALKMALKGIAVKHGIIG